MKEQELSDLAIAEGQKLARSFMEKYGKDSFVREVTLTEDRLSALLARAFDAGAKSGTRS